MAGPSSSLRVASAPRGRRAAGRGALLVAAAAAALVLARSAGCFSAVQGGGMSRKQVKGNTHTRNQLPRQVEDALPEPEVEAPPKELLPERRVPYTLHVVSHFPQGKHLHEESQASKLIQEKVVTSFENFESLIRHIEVNLQVSDNFHRDIDVKKKSKPQVGADGEVIEDRDRSAPQMVAPYVFKVMVSLRNHHTIVLANAEKHAQPTLIEGLDHMVDVIRKSLREEKERDIQARRRAKEEAMASDEEVEPKDMTMEANEIVEEMESEEDRKREEIYKEVESSSE